MKNVFIKGHLTLAGDLGMSGQAQARCGTIVLSKRNKAPIQSKERKSNESIV